MKIKVIERTTEIEADARELRESQSLGQNFMSMISRCFESKEPFDDDVEEENQEEIQEEERDGGN